MASLRDGQLGESDGISLHRGAVGQRSCSLACPTHDVPIVHRLDPHSVLDQVVKQPPLAPAGTMVEPKSEFIQVVVKVLAAHRTAMGAHKPSSECRCHIVHT